MRDDDEVWVYLTASTKDHDVEFLLQHLDNRGNDVWRIGDTAKGTTLKHEANVWRAKTIAFDLNDIAGTVESLVRSHEPGIRSLRGAVQSTGSVDVSLCVMSFLVENRALLLLRPTVLRLLADLDITLDVTF